MRNSRARRGRFSDMFPFAPWRVPRRVFVLWETSFPMAQKNRPPFGLRSSFFLMMYDVFPSSFPGACVPRYPGFPARFLASPPYRPSCLSITSFLPFHFPSRDHLLSRPHASHVSSRSEKGAKKEARSPTVRILPVRRPATPSRAFPFLTILSYHVKNVQSRLL